MANSDFIKKLIEPAMRARLSQIYGVAFTERAMPLRWSGEGMGSFRFDAVSEDGTILACLSTARGLKAGQRHKLLRDATFMWLVPGVKKRVLAVVDEGIATALTAEAQCGRLPPDTEIKVVAISDELLRQLTAFRATAVQEVSGEGRRKSPGGDVT
jgi:hypothetical protein